jgi:hypothetical protein
VTRFKCPHSGKTPFSRAAHSASAYSTAIKHFADPSSELDVQSLYDPT